MSGRTRRQFLRQAGLASGGLALPWMPAWAQPVSAGIAAPLPVLAGPEVELTVAHRMMTVDGRPSHAIAINGTVSPTSSTRAD